MKEVVKQEVLKNDDDEDVITELNNPEVVDDIDRES